ERDDDDDDDDDEEEIDKLDEQEDTESGKGDVEETESDEEETRGEEEESFDPIPRTPEESEDDGNNVGMMMIRKDPPLDQTGGRRNEEKVGSLNQLALHPNQQPKVQA
nr:hypothetical protein [Tanacetum cinerariifolium]